MREWKPVIYTYRFNSILHKMRQQKKCCRFCPSGIYQVVGLQCNVCACDFFRSLSINYYTAHCMRENEINLLARSSACQRFGAHRCKHRCARESRNSRARAYQHSTGRLSAMPPPSRWLAHRCHMIVYNPTGYDRILNGHLLFEI